MTMRLGTVLALVLLTSVLTIGAVYVFITPRDNFPAGTQSLPYRFSIGESPGVDTATDIFRLGQVTPGGSSWRVLTIDSSVSSATTEEQARRRVVVLARGDGSAWLSASPAIATLPADITVTLHAPADASLGVYEGTLYVVPYDQ